MSPDDVVKWVEEEAESFSEEVMLLTGWEHAIIGLLRDQDSELHVVYDMTVILNDLMKDMSYEEAFEYFSYNIEGLVPNDGGPLFVVRPPE